MTIEEIDISAITVLTYSALVAEVWITRLSGLKSYIEGYEDRALFPFLDVCAPDLLSHRIVIEHPEPDADCPGCTAAFARHGYRLHGRTRNNSLYLLAR